jgi:hypothetical protein
VTPDTLPHPHAARHAVTRMALWGGWEREEELEEQRTREGRSGGEKGGERERERERRCVGDMASV